jgi:hypothetical protein
VFITFKSSRSSKEVHPGSIEAFCYAYLYGYRERKRCTLSLSRVSPHHDQLLRPLDLICVSVTTVRCHDVTQSSFFCNCAHDAETPRADLVELHVVYTRYPDGYTTVTAPQRLYKGTLYPEPPMRKLHFCQSSTSPPLVFFLQLVLATLPLEHLSHQFHSSRASCSSVFIHSIEKKLRVD